MINIPTGRINPLKMSSFVKSGRPPRSLELWRRTRGASVAHASQFGRHKGRLVNIEWSALGEINGVSHQTAAITRLLKTAAAAKWKWNPRPKFSTHSLFFPLKLQSCGDARRLPSSLPIRAWLIRGKSNNSSLTWSTYCPTEGFVDKGRPMYERERQGGGEREEIQLSSEESQRLPSNIHSAIYLQDQQTGAREPGKFQTNNLKQGFPCREPSFQQIQYRQRPDRVPVGQLL